ncbi:cytochrome P450 [Durotheca rogersii]|uniref:cytochrome P450 n=1 Tax=Durotheca rogersii TaxID=419775 RepID=UPI00221F4E80|nr:cytochrome P450 [Durotheca rogersii]KAI5866017.1 cytochrome P450 [Durotheca rogersii]
MVLFGGINSLTLGLSVFVVIVLWKLSRIGQRPKNYPPGPPTLPLIGNIHQIPSEKRHIQFTKWAEEYGPIYSLMLGSQVMIVLSSDVVIKDLVDKRGAIYSSRPEAYLAQDVLSGGLRVLFMENSPNGTWKGVRKLLHLILNVIAARSYVPYQDLENKAMLMGLLESPNDFINHLRRYSASLTTQMTFGFRTVTMDDPRIKQAFDSFDRTSELIVSPTAALLDLIPVLRRLPDFLLPIIKEAREMHRRELKLFKDYYFDVKRGLRDGTAKPCISVDIVKMQKQEGLSDDLAAYISGQILQAGSETTAGILLGFIQAMVIFPEVAKAGQEELDRVCGDRIPDLNDVPNLLYIRACAKECVRWMPGLFLGVPHAVTQDDTYQGYHIPKGATVIMNVWGIHNDPKRHPNPRAFDPLRYIHDQQSSMAAANNPDATQRDHFGFGAGRRRCQGMHIADRSIFLALSRLLWAFDFRRAIDPATGRELVPDMDALVDGILAMPKPFPADIAPRTPARARRVREEWAQVAALLDPAMQWREVPKGLVWGDEQPQLPD